MPMNMSSLLLLDEKGKLIVLGQTRRALFSAQKNYEKNTCGIRVKNYLQKDGAQIAAISGSKHQASLYSVTVTRRDHRDLASLEIF
jgi:hypothetical protein